MTGGDFWIGAATDVGRMRDINEDSFVAVTGSGVFAVADGIGGHDHGEIASATIVQSLAAITPQPDSAALLEACKTRLIEANAKIRVLAAQRGKTTMMGSTVVALTIHDGRYACLWAGDSRAYLSRGGSLQQITRDHTEVEDLMERGLLSLEEARLWPRRNVVTRALGVSDEIDLEVRSGVAQPGDAFLLCSDGLTLHVEPSELRSEVESRGPQRACDELVALALDRGGQDNITVIVVRYRPEEDQTVLPLPRR
jgi:protein phosphatase